MAGNKKKDKVYKFVVNNGDMIPVDDMKYFTTLEDVLQGRNRIKLNNGDKITVIINSK